MNDNKKSKIKAIIIDDDLPSIKLLSEELSNRKDVELCAIAETLQEGEELIDKLQPDLLFLDMNFTEGNGLSWYEDTTLPENTKVVFHTCYQRYIHDALSLRVFDFLLKPFEASELDVIIKRFRSLQNDLGEGHSKPMDTSSGRLTNTNGAKLLSITSVTNSKVIVNPADIVYFRYLSERKIWECVFYSLKRIILKRQTTAETILGFGPDFVRTHKHFIVNVRYIGIINGNDCMLLPPLDNITEIKISKTYRKELMDRFYDI
ncbi:MAG: LytTR family DNA-binding domain-containing protein [Muribaculaceae bacterium]|nr:LytTR family DNA-binding domain-containing protein [Muribaculaceae bacterium]MDE6632141.1 LytTR family DNA-binding domain-containing protein [Muribaculaceae bacterium]